MPKPYPKLSKAKLKTLKANQTITEHGIEFKRLSSGDGRFAINTMVYGNRIHRVVGMESEGVTLTQAIQYLEKVRSEAREDRLNLPKSRKQKLTFERAAKQYLERLKIQEDRDLAKKESRLRLHLLPFFESIEVAAIKSFDLERYKKARRIKGASVASINRELAIMSHLFNKGEEWGWWSHKPCKVKLTKEDNARITWLTSDDCKRLLEAAKQDSNPQIYLFILIGLETGMRRSEILQLKYEHLFPEQEYLYIPKAKAGARHQPITERLAKVLKEKLTGCNAPSSWLFPSIGRTPSKTGHTTSIEEPFKRVVINAGLDPKSVTPHTMRHTAISHLIQRGVDLMTVKTISGHKTLSMVERYSHLSGGHVKSAMNQLQSSYEKADKPLSITHKLHTAKNSNKSEVGRNRDVVEIKAESKKYPFLYEFRNSLYEAPIYLEGSMKRVLGKQCS